jgi:hypothetical protein
MLVVVSLQSLLGIVATVSVLMTQEPKPPTAAELETAARVPLFRVYATSAHQANGALFIALVALAKVWARKAWKAMPMAAERAT